MTERKLPRPPHPAVILDNCPQLLEVIEELEAGTYPQPGDAVRRGDLPRDLAMRLAKATGATDEQIAEVIAETETGKAASAAAAPPEVNPENPDLIIRHDHKDGTLICGSSKGDGVYDAMKAAGLAPRGGWRYMPSIRMISVPQSRDHLAKRWLINRAAEVLRASGFTVAIEIDDTPRGVAQVKADRLERLDDRYGRLAAKAERNLAEGGARTARANQIGERFTGGQPILAGHHSARSARADQKRMDQNDRAARVAYAKAEYAARAASVVGDADRYRDLPAVIIRRIDRTEAELRKVMHEINGTRPANDWRGASGRKPATGARREELKARKTFLEHQIEADKAALAVHEANGYTRLSRETVHRGDRVFWGATWGDGIGGGIVTRVNPKTVTLDRKGYPRTLPYEEIKTVQCPHEGTETKVTNPKLPAQPKRETVTVERPPEREAPLTVGASTEFFPTPPAVADRMIEAAELEPGMTVLEPSAGLGAIAARVAPLVASVDCIELNQKLAERLRAAGIARVKVQCGDFLEVDPVALRQAEERGTWVGQAPAFDRVLMNPPFRDQADIRHVTHALGFLKPGGLLIAVMSAGTEFRQDKAATGFRELVAERGGRIERLPEDAFAASGISVRTVMAVIPASETGKTE